MARISKTKQFSDFKETSEPFAPVLKVPELLAELIAPLSPVHHTSEKFENACILFLRVRPTVHANPSRKRSFSETLAFRVSVNRKHFENGPFER